MYDYGLYAKQLDGTLQNRILRISKCRDLTHSFMQMNPQAKIVLTAC